LITPTQEQDIIVDAIGVHQKLKVSARAGAAKTTTLVLAAEAYKVPSLYIAYNKHMAEEARSKFPNHVEVRTAHSYAYQSHAGKIKHKLVRIPGPGGKYNNVCGTGSEIARHFKIAPLVISDSKSITAAAMGYAVRSTVANFEYSGDREISWNHVSYREADKVFTNIGFDKIAYRDRVLKYAKKLWELRIDSKSDILATHDTYLKLWQLSNPTFEGFEIIYVDEFQDMNGCLLDVVMNHNGKIIGVGDDHQSIYGWRGSLNAMQICDWPEFGLTKSFRFGQEIAEVAKDILLDKVGKRSVVFFGNEAISTKIVDKAPESGYTMIFRTNSALIEHGLDLILRGKKVNMHIDVSDFKSMMNSAYALAKNDMKNVKHQDIVPYVSWAEFCEEIGVVRNAELKRIHKFILDGRFHAIMDTLANYKRVDDPDVELISGHKSKGLEFDHVVLADDFEFHEIEDDGSWKGFSGQEQNLLYVAATRAKKSLKINDQIVGVQEYGRGRECGKSVKLEDAKIYKYESYMRAPSLNLMADVEQRMSEFGMIMTDLDHFIEGHPASVSEHWENLEDGVPRFGN
jgi:hypothetical protein